MFRGWDVEGGGKRNSQAGVGWKGMGGVFGGDGGKVWGQESMTPPADKIFLLSVQAYRNDISGTQTTYIQHVETHWTLMSTR